MRLEKYKITEVLFTILDQIEIEKLNSKLLEIDSLLRNLHPNWDGTYVFILTPTSMLRLYKNKLIISDNELMNSLLLDRV